MGPAAPAGATGVVSAPSHGPARLRVEGLHVERGGRAVLRGVDLELRHGEVLGLLGPNGAGKTTLFKLLCGLVPASGGRLLADGREVSPADRAFRAGCGVVFQEPALDPRLGARTNLILAAALYGVGRREAARRAVPWLERIGLAERADEPVAKLSGGMRRRVEIVRALIHAPQLLLLDEPTSGLDEAAFRRVWADLLELRERHGLSLLVTTHRPEEAEHCDRLAILDRGAIVACDTPESLRARVAGDLVEIEADDPAAVVETLRVQLGLEARVVEGRAVLQRESAHQWVPRIVEALPGGSLRSIAVRRTGLGEVFLALTGHTLSGDEQPAAPEPR